MNITDLSVDPMAAIKEAVNKMITAQGAGSNPFVNPTITPEKDLLAKLLAFKYAPQSIPAAPVANAARASAGLAEGTNIPKLLEMMKSMKFGGMGSLTPARSATLAGILPQIVRAMGVDKGEGAFGFSPATIGGVGGAAVGGLPGIATAVASPFVGHFADQLGEYQGRPDSDFSTAAWLKYNQSGEDLRKQRQAQPNAQGSTEADYLAADKASVAESDQAAGTDATTGGDIFTKLLAVDAKLGGYTKLRPEQKMAMRAKAAMKLIQKYGTKDESEKYMVGAWVHGGPEVFDNITQIQERNKKQVGPSLMSMMAKGAIQDVLAGNRVKANYINEAMSEFNRAATKLGSPVKAAEALGLPTTGWWKFKKFDRASWEQGLKDSNRHTPLNPKSMQNALSNLGVGDEEDDAASDAVGAGAL